MAFFIDAHCHPTLKRYLFGHSVYSRSRPRRDNNYTNIQVTVPAMETGEINGALAAHYLPEKQILEDWRLFRFLKPLLKIFAGRLTKKVEQEDAFLQTISMIEDFEKHIGEKDVVAIAHHYNELLQYLEMKKKVFVHTLEGGHHLGRGLEMEQYARNIEQLKKKGVALITIAHFYPNDIAHPIEGIPPKSKKLLGMRYKPDPSVGLSGKAKQIIAILLDKGMIIDLTHTNPVSRKQVFELNRSRTAGMRPIVFSHVGVRANFKDERHPEFALMGPDDEEIRAIKECNGVIGIIFMNYWLTGKEKSLFLHNDYGFKHIVDTIRHIVSVTGSFDQIAIGTDFDGMTDPPDDFYHPSMLADFRRRLFNERASFGASHEDVEKILGGNMLRVLKDGWN